jgi:hypothetical protein
MNGFIRRFGEVNIFPYKKKASTAFAAGDLLAFDSNGFVLPATATTVPSEVAGIAQRTVASTDSDYAENSFVPVDVPRPHDDLFEVAVSTGTAAQTDVGERVDLDDANSIDVDAVLTGVVKVEKVISTTAVVVSFPGVDLPA